MKAKVMPDGRLSLPADLRRRHGLGDGGEVIVEDIGDAIVLRTLDQVVARAQDLSRRLVGDKSGASVADFFADRIHQAGAECRNSSSTPRPCSRSSSTSREPIR